MFKNKLTNYFKNDTTENLLLIALGMAVVAGIFMSINYLTPYFKSDRIEIFKVIIQACGGILIFYGLILNKRRTDALQKQVDIAEDSNVTDRFQKAIEQLGSDNATIRTGGIHSLARIAEESILKDTGDWKTIIEVFNSFIQNNITNKVTEDYIGQIDYETIIKHLFFNKFAEKRINNVFKVEFNNVTAQLFKQKSPCIKQAIFNDCKFIELRDLYFENCDFKDLNLLYDTIINHRSIDFDFCSFIGYFNGRHLSESSNFDNCNFGRIVLNDSNLGNFTNCIFLSLNLINCNFYDVVFDGSTVGLISISEPICLNDTLLLGFKEIKKIQVGKNLPEREVILQKVKKKWPTIEIL